MKKKIDLPPKLRLSTCGLILVGLMILLINNGCSSWNKQSVMLIKKNPAQASDDPVLPDAKKQKESESVEWLQKPQGEEAFAELDGIEKEGKYLMNFNDLEIEKFITSMMSEVFRLNYMITDGVKSIKTKITIKMTEDLPKTQTFKLFQKILELNNVKMTREANTYIFNSQSVNQISVRGPIVYGRRVPDKLPITDSDEVSFLVPIYNVNPINLQTIIRRQLSPPYVFEMIKGMNVLFINGRYEEIKYILAMIDLIDRPQFKEKSIVMIHPKYWNIDDFFDKIKVLLEAEGMDWKNAEETKSMVFIPIENLNYLLMISSSKEWVDRVIYWMKQLDVPDAAGESKKVWSYKLHNVEIDAVMNVLQGYQDEMNVSAMKSATRTMGPGGVGPGGPSPMSMGPGMGSSSRDKTFFPIKETNSIIIVADAVEYKKYLDILKKIDVPRNQVFVEVLIGEISVDQSSQLGLEFWINKYLYRTEYGTRGGLGVFKPEQAGTITIPSGANTFVRGVLPGTQYEMLINALVTNSKINIISSPKLTVVENQEAEISVGSDIPTLSSESAGGGVTTQPSTGSGSTATGGLGYSIPFRQISYVETGIMMKIKASILSDNKISLELTQEISEAQTNTKSDISSPEILKRSIKTTMIVNEGEIGLIGGLIQKKKTSGKSGIPILSQIPLIGNLFKKESRINRKTELVFFINAKTIKRSSEMDQVVNEMKRIVSDASFLEDQHVKPQPTKKPVKKK